MQASCQKRRSAGVLAQRLAVDGLQDRGVQIGMARAGALPPVMKDSLGPSGELPGCLVHCPILALSWVRPMGQAGSHGRECEPGAGILDGY